MVLFQDIILQKSKNYLKNLMMNVKKNIKTIYMLIEQKNLVYMN